MKYFGFILFIFLHTTPCNAQSIWTLEQCLSFAKDHNLQIKQAELQQKIYKNNLLQTKLDLLPDVNSDMGYNFSFGNSINPTTYTYQNVNAQSLTMGVNGSLPLFTGLQQYHNILKSKVDLEASKQDYLNTINSTALTITNQFLQVILSKELLLIAKKQIDISTNQLETAKKKIAGGVLAETAKYEYEAQLAKDEASVTQQKNAVEINLMLLKIALQLPDNAPFDVKAPETDNYLHTAEIKSAENIFEYAKENQPAIRSANEKLKSAKLSEKIAKGTLSPTLTMNVSLRDNYYNQATHPGNISYKLDTIGTPIYKDFSNTNPLTNIVGFDRLKIAYDNIKTPIGDQLKNNFSKTVGFSLNIPIYNGWRKMNNVANSKIQYQIQQLNLENSYNNLKKDIYQAFANYTSNKSNYEVNLKATEAAQKAYQVAEKRNQVGLATFFEMQQSRTNQVAAESRLQQAKFNYVWSQKVLEFYQGIPIKF